VDVGMTHDLGQFTVFGEIAVGPIEVLKVCEFQIGRVQQADQLCRDVFYLIDPLPVNVCLFKFAVLEHLYKKRSWAFSVPFQLNIIEDVQQIYQ
jgi:hypothetical protein